MLATSCTSGKRFQTFEFPKIDFEKFYNAFLVSMSRNVFFFMLFYGRVVNMTSMSIIFYFEQVNECWQLPTLVAKGFRHLNLPKSTMKNFYNAHLGSMSTNVFFWVHEFENIDFLKEFWSKIFFFLKVFQVVEEGLGGISIDFFDVLRLPGAYKRMKLELYVMANIGASEQIPEGFSMWTLKTYPSQYICAVIQM